MRKRDMNSDDLKFKLADLRKRVQIPLKIVTSRKMQRHIHKNITFIYLIYKTVRTRMSEERFVISSYSVAERNESP